MNNISVSYEHLEHINEQLIMLSIDSGELALALQAVQVDCAVSGGVISAVIMALSGISATSEDITEQIDDMLSAPQAEVANHE